HSRTRRRSSGRAKGRSGIATSSCCGGEPWTEQRLRASLPRSASETAHVPTDLLDRWLTALLATPGLPARRAPDEARRVLLDDALRGMPLVEREDGPIVDVGSGGGTPGIPRPASSAPRGVPLLEAERRKCDFLEQWRPELPNLRVIWGRAEEQPLESYGVAGAQAPAHPAQP